MSGVSLLLIEDDAQHADMFCQMLLGAGPFANIETVQVAQSLAEAQAVLRADPSVFDAILLDLNLSDSHGIATLKALQKIAGSCAVVVLTGQGAEDIGLLAVEAGAQDFLQKDQVDHNILHRTLSYAVERHQQAQALIEAQQMQVAVLQATSSAIIAIDAEARVLSVNPAAQALLGPWSGPFPSPWPQDIVFRNAETFRILAPTENPLVRARAGEEVRAELVAVNRGDVSDIRFVRISATPPETSRTPLALVLSLDDVTQEYRARKQLEQANRLDALGQFTGGLAHDFNNVLGTILPSLQLASHTSKEPQTREILEPALSATRRGAGIVRQLLSFSMPPPEEETQVNLALALREIRDQAAKTTQIPISLEDIGEAIEVCCDPDQLKSAILNLLLNARDAIEQGGTGDRIWLSVRYLQQSMGAAPMVEIAVRDNGPGMDPEVQARAMDPFFTTKSPQEGTGLGLSMVYGFVTAAGGGLDISSVPGRGCVMCMTLPPTGGRPAPDPAIAPRPEAWVSGKGYRLLLVEDEGDLRVITRATLQALGFEVVEVAQASEALDLLATEPAFDLLFTDIVLPGQVNGYALAAQACALCPDLKVIYTSGHSGAADQRAPPVPGPFLPKPYDIYTLSDAFKRVLKPT